MVGGGTCEGVVSGGVRGTGGSIKRVTPPLYGGAVGKAGGTKRIPARAVGKKDEGVATVFNPLGMDSLLLVNAANGWIRVGNRVDRRNSPLGI